MGDSQDIDDDGTELVDVYPADKPADNAITQQDAINLTCCNCRRAQCEEVVANYGECYRIIFTGKLTVFNILLYFIYTNYVHIFQTFKY